MAGLPEAEIVIVGDEILAGFTRERHLEYLGRALGRLGSRIRGASVVGDDLDAVAGAVKRAMGKSALVFVCGGLGPTPDDVTREAVARAVGVPLVFDESVAASIKGFFESRGMRVELDTLRQAYFPRGADVLTNPLGTASGFSVESEGSTVFVLPGPPIEMVEIFSKEVIPRLKASHPRGEPFHKIFRFSGIGESRLSTLLAPLTEEFSLFAFSFLPQTAGVDLLIRESSPASSPADLERAALELERKLSEMLGYRFYGKGEQTLEEVIGKELAERSLTLSVAESITGGLIAKRITDVPGSSRYFVAGVTAYADEAKVTLLGVSEETLSRFGAVSEEVCREMAVGVMQRTGSDWSVASTGIAGPGGGSGEKPVGLCYYGVACGGVCDLRRAVFPGSRVMVRERAAQATLLLLHKSLYEWGRVGGKERGD